MEMTDPKASKLRPPSKIGRPCCTVPPKPALPPSPPRSTMNNSVVLTDDTDSFIIGDRVWVGGTKPGCIAYIGETQFAPGDWAGVVLDEAIGKNDGSVAGSRYFQCEPKRGIFSRLTRLTRQPLTESMVMSPSGEKTPTNPTDGSRYSFNKSMSLSLNASTTSLASICHKDLKIGDRVIVSSSHGSKTGVLRYVGTTEFAPGEWCGVELDDPVGKNDGSVAEIRYFECRPMHGLFAPLHKVSRSPSSRRQSGMCAIHRPTGMNSSVRRTGGSRESLGSMSSVASTNASLATRGTTSGSRRPGLHTSTPARSSLQEMLKEKQLEIKMLRKERDFERNRISKAATQANNAEQTDMDLKQEYNKYRKDMEQTVREAEMSMAQLLEEKNTLRAHLEEERQKSEDLLFRFEEESVNKDDIQNQIIDESVVNTLNQSKLKELEKQLGEERERVIQLENENTKLFETEEEIIKLRTELSTALSHEQKNVQDIQNRNLCLEEAKITLEKQMLERNDLIEQYANRIKELEFKFVERERENIARRNIENNEQKNSDELQNNLLEKCALIEKMKKDHEINLETHEKEMNELKRVIERMTKESEETKTLLDDEHRKIIDEKENTIKLRLEDFEMETKRHKEMHTSALEKLRSENIEQINSLSENFHKQLAEKDKQIISIVSQLEERSAEIEMLVNDLSTLRDTCFGKNEELKTMLKHYEELCEKLKLSEESNDELKKEIDGMGLRKEETYPSFAKEKRKLEESVARLLTTSGDSSAQLEKLNEDLKTKEKELTELRNAKAAEIEELRKICEKQIEDKTKFINEITADASQKSLRLSALEDEIENLNKIIANKDEEIKNLLEKTAELQDAITLSEQTKTNLESELRMYDVNIAELNLRLSRAEEKSTQLTEQKSNLEAEIASVISTSSNSSDQLIKYSEDLRTKEKELDELRESSFKLENTLSLSQTKLISTIEQLEKTNKLTEKLRDESVQLKNELTTNQKTNDELTSTIHELTTQQQKLLQVAKDNENLEEELKSKIMEVSNLNEKLKRTEENIIIMQEKYSSLEVENNEKEKQLDIVSTNLANEISRLRKELEKSHEKTENLSIERTNFEKALSELKNNVDAEVNEKRKLDHEIKKMNDDVERTATKMEVLKKERDDANAVVQSLTEIHNETLTKLALLNSDLANTKARNSPEITNLRQQLARTESNSKEISERLEERENVIKRLNEKLLENLNISKSKETENLHLSENLKETNVTMKKLTESSNNRELEYNEKLQKRDHDNSKLEDKLKDFERELITVKDELDGKLKVIEKIKTENEILNKRIGEFENSRKIKEIEIESVTKITKDAEEERKDLQTNIVALNDDLTAKEALCQEMKREIKNLHDIRKNDDDDEEQEKDIKLKAEQTKFIALYKANDDLRIARESTEKTSKSDREKIESLSNLLRESEISSAKNIRNLEDKLNLESTEVAMLKENQCRLEKENKQIVEKLNKALEDLKIHNENKKNNKDIESYPMNQTIRSAGGDMNQNSDRDDELKKIGDENEMYKSQIEFLNSVIVDMQRKNETLLCKIEVLEMGVPANEAEDYTRSTLDKRMTAPRMFCDICDQFDLHETEDCPRQSQDFAEEEKPRKSLKKPPVDRPYCEICEKFGHETINCDDTETF